MDKGIPYFMTNELWFYYDEVAGIYRLTSLAPEEAIKSYEEYYKEDDTDI